MGSPSAEAGRTDNELPHRRRIARTFALAATAVTLDQYRKFAKDYALPAAYTRSGDLPVVGINWYMAARYCNWLSAEEGLAEAEWCYAITGGVDESDVALKANYLSLGGYRLPTEAEMEYATRAAAVTSRYYGETDELLPKYAWYTKNSQEQIWPVGSLKPNDYGLFDAQGNVFTWCQESSGSYPEGAAVHDGDDGGGVVKGTVSRVLRGGSFSNPASNVRSAVRGNYVPSNRNFLNGFRPARTLLHIPLTSLPPSPEGSRLIFEIDIMSISVFTFGGAMHGRSDCA